MGAQTLVPVLAVACLLALLRPAGARAADPVRGGLLYDKYWAVGGLEPPAGKHPLYPPNGRQSGADTHRCKECHGWDYKGAAGAYATGSHATGIRGVYGSTKTAQQMFDLIGNPPSGATPNGHGFGGHGLSDHDVEDLVEFVRTLMIDTNLYIDGDKRFRGDAAAGQLGYTGGGLCRTCHGPDGKTLNFGTEEEPEFVGTIAVANPWELLHKIRFGHPGSVPEMPSWIANGGTDQGAADIGRYAEETLPTGREPPPPTREPDAIRGGLLYDEYWELSGPEPESGNHPLYPPAGRQAGEVTYRCKECHGWDYKGAAGAYATGSHATGVRGVYGSTKSAPQMFDLIKNPATDRPHGHGYGALGLADDDVHDLVAFLKTLVIDTDLYIDESRRFRGDPVRGEQSFSTTGACSICHGPDGTRLNFGDDDEPEFVGTVAVENPWELLHKGRIGQPGSIPVMPSWIANGGTDQGVADIGRYIQDSLPGGDTVAIAVKKGVAQRSRKGSWSLNVAANYDPGDYAAETVEFRLRVDGVPYFDSIGLGPIRKLKRDRRTGRLIKFKIGGAGRNKAAVNLKARRLTVILKDVAPERFDPSDGVDLSVQLGPSWARVITPVTFRGRSKAILVPVTAEHAPPHGPHAHGAAPGPQPMGDTDKELRP